MKWILVLVWINGGAAISGQYGPFADRPTCERVRAELLKDTAWSGTMRASCALSSIDPTKLPQIETSGAPIKDKKD